MNAHAARNRALIVALAAKRLTARQIAKKTKLHLGSVYRHLTAAGISAASPRDESPLANRSKVLLLVQSLGATKAAAKLKVSRQAIYDRLKKWKNRSA